MKKIIVIGLLIVAVAGGFFLFRKAENQDNRILGASYKDATYLIDGKSVTLAGGVSEVEAAPGSTGSPQAGSASKIITRYFGNEVMHDFDGDGREDIVFLLTQETGGSGTFFYVVVALNKESGYVGSEARFLGDRIAPQTIEMSQNPSQNNVVVVNYADRAPGESFTVQPSVGKSIWLLLDTNTLQFGEVAQNFEGEADPSRMTLDMKSWIWINAKYNDGREVVPKQKLAFTIDFFEGGEFSATTDCNRMAGKYSVTGDKNITLSDIISTKMYCGGSQESEFAQLLTNAASYHFTSKGELILDLKFDSGSVVFR